MTGPNLEPLNRPDKRDQIEPFMANIASDPIGAFQQVSNVLMAVLDRLDAAEKRLSVLEDSGVVHSSQ